MTSAPWTARQDEILSEHLNDFQKEHGRAPDRDEIVDLLAERSREAEDDEPALAAELDVIIDAYMDREPEPEPLPDGLADALDEAIEAIEQLGEAISRSGGRDSRHSAIAYFSAYHLADLQGADAGWLGGRHLIDALRQLRSGEEA